MLNIIHLIHLKINRIDEKHIKGHITRKQEKEMAKQNEMMQQVAGKPSSVAQGTPPVPKNPTISNMLGDSVNSNNIGK